MKNEIRTYDSDYTLDFGSGLNSNGRIRFIDRAAKKESYVEIELDDKEFKFRSKQEFPSVVADLMDLAVAIHAADRLAFQNLRQAQTRIHVILPVRHPEIMNTESFRSQLESLLDWATGSRWLFDFSKRSDTERSVVQQSSLSLASQREVAMWSGGLDAFAGLYQRLRSHPEKSFVLFGTGGNVNVHKLQEDTEKQIRAIFPGRCTLYRVPISFRDSNLDRSKPQEVQWEALTRKFPNLDDIVDRCHVVEKLTTLEMQSKLIRLYQNYVAEWDDVKSQLSVNLIKSRTVNH